MRIPNLHCKRSASQGLSVSGWLNILSFTSLFALVVGEEGFRQIFETYFIKSLLGGGGGSNNKKDKGHLAILPAA